MPIAPNSGEIGSPESRSNSGGSSASHDDHDSDSGWRDSDGDGIADNMDKYPNDPNRSGYGEDAYGQNDNPEDNNGDDANHGRATAAADARGARASQYSLDQIRQEIANNPSFLNRVLDFAKRTLGVATLGVSDLFIGNPNDWEWVRDYAANQMAEEALIQEGAYTAEEMRESYGSGDDPGNGQGGGGNGGVNGEYENPPWPTDGTGSTGSTSEGAMSAEDSLADTASRSQDIADESWSIYRDTFLPYEEATAKYNQAIQELSLPYYESVMPAKTAFDTASLNDQTQMIEMSADKRHENFMTGLDVEGKYLTGAMEGVDPNQWAREGAADMISRYDATQNETLSAIAGMGGSRYSAIDSIAKLNRDKAKSVGAAMTAGRRGAEAENWGRLSGVANYTKGLPTANPNVANPNTNSNGANTTASMTTGAMGNATSGYSSLYSGRDTGGGGGMSIGDWTMAGAMAGSQSGQGLAGMAGGALLGWGAGQAERIFG